MTIKKMLRLSWGFLLVLTLVLLFALYNVRKNDLAIDGTQEARKNSLELARELQESSRGLTDAVRQYAVTADERFAADYMDIVKIRGGEKARPADRAIAPGQTVALSRLMEQAGFTKSELNYLQQASDLSNALIVLETRAMNAVAGKFQDQSGSYSVKGDPDAALAAKLVFSAEYRDSVRKIMAPINEFQKELNTRLDTAVRESEAGYDRAMLILEMTVIAILVLFAAALFLASRLIIRPTLQCNNFAMEVARGNLDSVLDYESGNEIGSLASSLRSMVSSLRERIGMAEQATRKAEEQSALAAEAVREAEEAKRAAEAAKSQGMRQAGEQLLIISDLARKTTAELSEQIIQAQRGAESQQQQLAESTRAMEQLNQAVMDVARNTTLTEQSADETRRNAQSGFGIVTDMVKAIEAVDQKTGTLRASLNQLGEQAEGIGRIMSVITDIADQTNLLALNAAIEAARAGEAGRGFAVVADEVRKLAEKTMQATGEVGSAVRAIQTGTTENIRGMEDALTSVKESTNMAKSAGDSLQHIVEIAKGTAEKVHSIAVAAEEQSSTCEQLTGNTEAINQVAGATMQVMRNAGAAVEDINTVVKKVLDLTDKLRNA